MSRTLVFHYFGHREALVLAVVELFLRTSAPRVTGPGKASPGQARRALLRACFPNWTRAALRDASVMADLMSLAARDEKVRALVAQGWTEFVSTVAEELETIFPRASKADVQETAYALTCLMEQHGSMVLLGVGRPYSQGIRKVADRLLERLGPTSPAGR